MHQVIRFTSTIELVGDPERCWRSVLLATEPDTKGGNTTWAIWFDDRGQQKSSGYAEKWAKYRLDGQVSTLDFADNAPKQRRDNAGDLKAEVKVARERIAEIAGVQTDSVRISIDFGSG